jgi:hypothetical protein
MVLVEGENGDGALVDQDNFDVAVDDDAATFSAADQVVSAILGTREGAAEGGYQLTSTGVTWTDPIEAAALRDALATRKVENVMLVSAFLAAAALTHAVGNETNYAQTALLFIEPDTATLAVVSANDGSIADIHRQPLPEDDEAAVAQLAEMVSGAERLETRPDAVFVVGSGVDIPLIKPALEAATSLPVTMPEEPDTALARGAALASANTPLLVSSTAALAYAQDPGTGAVNPYTLDAAYFEDVSHSVATGAGAVAYSAVAGEHDTATQAGSADHGGRKPFALVGSVLASIFIIGVTALVVSLAVSIRTTSGVRPDPGHNVVAPTQPAPAAPAPAAPAPAPAAPAPAPESVPAAPAPAPAPAAQAPAPASVPEAPVPVPQAPAPVLQAPAPVPEAPAPAPVAPIPVPVPIPLPIFSPQLPIWPGGGGGGHGGDEGHGGGGHGGGGHGGGGRGGGFGIPGIPGI